MAQVKIEDATQAQLLWFAQVRLSLKRLNPNTGADKLREKIREVWAENFIETDEVMPKDGNAGPRSERGGYSDETMAKHRQIDPLRFGALDPLVNIRVHSDRQKGGDRPVPAHLNGTEYWVPRNKDVNIPYRYFMVLQEAVGDIHDGWDDEKRRNSEARETQSYTFTVNRKPTQEEIENWERAMKPHLDKQRRQKMARIRKTRAVRDDEASYAA